MMTLLLIHLILCQSVLCKAGENAPAPHVLLAEHKKKVIDNIFPIMQGDQYRFMDYNGKPVNEHNYAQCVRYDYDFEVFTLARRDDHWYSINAKGHEKPMNFPAGYEPVFRRLESALPPKLFVLHDMSPDNHSVLKERLFDTARSEFVTPHVGTCTYCDDCWIGMVLRNPSNVADGTRAIIFRRNKDGAVEQTVTEFERAYVRNNCILAHSIDGPSPNPPDIYGKKMNLIAKSTEAYFIAKPDSPDRILVWFRINDADWFARNSMGIIDSKGNKLCGGYDLVSNYSNDMARVAIIGDEMACHYGYVNRNGEQVIPCHYPSASLFTCEIAYVYDPQKKKACVINKEGRSIAEIGPYRDVSGFGRGAILDRSDEGVFTLVNTEGKILWQSKTKSEGEKLQGSYMYYDSN